MQILLLTMENPHESIVRKRIRAELDTIFNNPDKDYNIICLSINEENLHNNIIERNSFSQIVLDLIKFSGKITIIIFDTYLFYFFPELVYKIKTTNRDMIIFCCHGSPHSADTDLHFDNITQGIDDIIFSENLVRSEIITMIEDLPTSARPDIKITSGS